MIWPDMIWAWVIAYDLWNFAYTYNCISDHSAYCGLALLLACTIPTFFIKKGAWLQHRAQTLGLWIMFVMTVPAVRRRAGAHPHHAQPHGVLRGQALLALASNVALAVYQFRRIRQRKLNTAQGRAVRRHQGLPAGRRGEPLGAPHDRRRLSPV